MAPRSYRDLVVDTLVMLVLSALFWTLIVPQLGLADQVVDEVAQRLEVERLLDPPVRHALEERRARTA